MPSLVVDNDDVSDTESLPTKGKTEKAEDSDRSDSESEGLCFIIVHCVYIVIPRNLQKLSFPFLKQIWINYKLKQLMHVFCRVGGGAVLL